ncbi:MAG: hypothetical protein KDB45_15370, partial [Mycobacterium sp.]|nr:hypothetical protein [Mycobacterium sp.]
MSATEVEHRLRQVGGAFVLVLVLQVNLDGRPVSALVLGPVLLALVWRVHGATLADGARLDLAPAFVVGAGALVAAGALWWPGIDP